MEESPNPFHLELLSNQNLINQKLPTKDSNLVRQLATRLIPSLLHLSEGKPESVQAYVQRLEQE